MELQTKRLLLRAWKESDAEALYKYAQNPNVGPIAGWAPHTSVENSREIIKTVLSAPETYAVVLKETGEAVGSVGIMTARSEIHSAKIADNECEIGYWIGEPYWGQGLIPEAVNELLRYAFENLWQTTVWCGYYDGNEKSKRVQEKCGFVYSHTEVNKTVPLLNEVRTEHFTKISQQEWRATSLVAMKEVNVHKKQQNMKEKSIISHQADGQTFLEVLSEKQFIGCVQDALDLIGEFFGQYYDGIIIHEHNISPHFFELKTRLAGDILQKFSNYRLRLAIVGDWSKYTSHSLAAFIVESNRGRMVNFATSTEEAVALLSRFK